MEYKESLHQMVIQRIELELGLAEWMPVDAISEEMIVGAIDTLECWNIRRGGDWSYGSSDYGLVEDIILYTRRILPIDKIEYSHAIEEMVKEGIIPQR